MTATGWDDAVWQNWAGDLRMRPLRHYRPRSLAEVVALVQEAESQPIPHHVHAVGSSWSFSGPGATCDYIVETRQLSQSLNTVTYTGISDGDPAAQRWGAPVLGVCHVEAGITLYKLCQRLDQPPRGEPSPVLLHGTPSAPITRWALPTMGGSSGQTLAGAIATGTHGMDAHLPPLADAVRALHLVGPGGRQHWIERAAAVTTQAGLQAAYPGITAHYDDDMLAAAVISLGRFGIVYAVLLDVVPQYALRSSIRRLSWQQARAALGTGQILAEHRGVQLVVSPYRAGTAADRTCYLTTRDVGAVLPRTRPMWFGQGVARALLGGGSLLRSLAILLGLTWLALRQGQRHGPGRRLGRRLTWLLQLPLMSLIPLAAGRPGDLVAAVCRTANAWRLAGITRGLTRGVLAAAHRRGTREAVSFQAMAGPPWVNEYYRGNSVEVFFNATTAYYLEVIEQELLPIIEKHAERGHAIAGWFSLRYMARSSALLAMQQWPCTVSVEVAVLRGIPGSVQVLRELEHLAIAHGGLVHWGQQNNLDKVAVARMYPALPKWREMLRLLAKTEVEAGTFLNSYCAERGLTV
ncbi:hypothetical protein ACI784_09385 [Geodermatophilus sp. SYSU D01186]